VLPIVSPTVEKVEYISKNEVTIQKPEGLVSIISNLPIQIKEIIGKRTFNMVPGVEAIPFEIFFDGDATIELTINVA
jgi:hypothetical protein